MTPSSPQGGTRCLSSQNVKLFLQRRRCYGHNANSATALRGRGGGVRASCKNVAQVTFSLPIHRVVWQQQKGHKLITIVWPCLGLAERKTDVEKEIWVFMNVKAKSTEWFDALFHTTKTTDRPVSKCEKIKRVRQKNTHRRHPNRPCRCQPECTCTGLGCGEPIREEASNDGGFATTHRYQTVPNTGQTQSQRWNRPSYCTFRFLFNIWLQSPPTGTTRSPCVTPPSPTSPPAFGTDEFGKVCAWKSRVCGFICLFYVFVCD